MLWSKNPRFTINLTLFDRLPLHPEVNALVGNFTSLTMLGLDLTQAETFFVRAQQVQNQLWDDLDHRYISGVQVLREIAHQRHDTAHIVMPIVFTSHLVTTNLELGSLPPDWPANWLGETKYSITQTSQVWLDNQMREIAGALDFNWDVVEGLFPAGMIEAMFTAYVRRLQQLADDPTSWQLNWTQVTPVLLPPTQIIQVAAINATTTPPPTDLLHELFMAQVSQHKQQPAVITPQRTLTYGQLEKLALQTANWLRTHGAQPNQLVAVVMEKGWEQVVAVLGILQAGAAYVPIDPHLPQERLTYLLQHIQTSLILIQPQWDALITWPSDVLRLAVTEDALANLSAEPLHTVQTDTDLAYVIFTSGSTGLPKGVMIDHRGAVNTIIDVNQRFNVQSTDRVFAISALNFDLSVYDIFGPLAAGGALVLPAPTALQDPAQWALQLREQQVTMWNSVPALMKMLVDYANKRGDILPVSLRLVMLSGDWIPVALPDQIRDLLPNTEVISLGGATEASIWSILYPIGQVDAHWPSIPYGRPMRNQRFYVLNKTLTLCPTWVPGDLYIGGLGLAQGYFSDPEKTNAHFFIHPNTGERLYRTGDLGRYLLDGNIEFLGREDFQVKIRGYRIELGEIETALRQHPAVGDALVVALAETVGKTPPPAGGNKRLVAYVTRGDAELSTETTLREFLSHKLPDYMIPTTWVMLDTWPLTPNGKIDRKALPVPIQQEAAARAASFVAPRSLTEEILAEIWSEVLHITPISVHADFFDLGGDSVLIVQIAVRLWSRFEIELSISTLFEHSTIAALALQVERELLNDIETGESA